MCGIEWFDIEEVASTLKETILEVRKVVESRAESRDRRLRELHFSRSCVPESWKDNEVSGHWASERVGFDEDCWESYWTAPFNTIPRLSDYLYDVMERS